MSNGIANTSKRSRIFAFIENFHSIFFFQLETFYQSKQETLNEKEMRIGERFKVELEVCLTRIVCYQLLVVFIL